MYNFVNSHLKYIAIAGIITAATMHADAGTVLLISYPDPGIKLVVDTISGDAKLIGNPGAVMSQFTITSISGSIDFTKYYDMEHHANNQVHGLDNYIAWMNMSDPQNNPPRIWDKCCPASDPWADGAIYFDNLTDHTLELGQIFKLTGAQDLVFAYSYGYVTDATGWQLIGYGTEPEPVTDGVSSFGTVIYTPEPASLMLLPVGLLVDIYNRRRRLR